MDIPIEKPDVDLRLEEKDNWPVRTELSSSGVHGDGRELRVNLLLDTRDAHGGDIRVEPPLQQRCRQEMGH